MLRPVHRVRSGRECPLERVLVRLAEGDPTIVVGVCSPSQPRDERMREERPTQLFRLERGFGRRARRQNGLAAAGQGVGQ